ARQDALVSILAEQDEEPAADDPSVNDDPQSAPDVVRADEPAGDSSTAVDALELPDRGPAVAYSDTLRAFEFAVGPDTTDARPDALIEREQIPQKWLRVDVDLGALRIDLSQGADAVDLAVDEFNTEMRNRIERAIDAWLADSDPNAGGALWAFPEGHGMQSRT